MHGTLADLDRLHHSAGSQLLRDVVLVEAHDVTLRVRLDAANVLRASGSEGREQRRKRHLVARD